MSMPDRVGRALPLLPSVLDRLIDDAPELSTEPPKQSAQLLRELKQAVRRDLERLLNTRWRCVSWPPSLQELDYSVVNYGIPDFTSAHLRAAEDPDVLCAVIKSAIEHFEPRLKNVRVDPVENSQELDRTLRFRIDAVLTVEPIEDRVLFNSTVEPTTGNFHVEGGVR